MVSRIFNPDELPSLIEAASSEDQAKVIYPPSKDAAQTFIDITDERSLSKDAAQTLIDVIDEVRSPPFRHHAMWLIDDAIC